MTDAPTLHPACEQIADLLGTWRGSGAGEYPTIDSFSYEEEVKFWHVGKPFLAYSQRTWNPTTGAPMHAESGYWRPLRDGRIEIVFSHPFGIVEIQEGSIADGVIAVTSKTMAGTSTAKEVSELTRTFTLDGDSLGYEISMAAVGLPLTHHLRASLKRTA